MAYTVRKLLESEQFPKMKLLCGKKGLDREVEQHFEDLVKSDISGFIVKKREEDDPTGKRLKLLEKHCEKYEIPLLEIPEDLSNTCGQHVNLPFLRRFRQTPRFLRRGPWPPLCRSRTSSAHPGHMGCR